MWSDWYTLLNARETYHTLSDFSRSASRCNEKIKSWTILGPTDEISVKEEGTVGIRILLRNDNEILPHGSQAVSRGWLILQRMSSDSVVNGHPKKRSIYKKRKIFSSRTLYELGNEGALTGSNTPKTNKDYSRRMFLSRTLAGVHEIDCTIYHIARILRLFRLFLSYCNMESRLLFSKIIPIQAIGQTLYFLHGPRLSTSFVGFLSL